MDNAFLLRLIVLLDSRNLTLSEISKILNVPYIVVSHKVMNFMNENLINKITNHNATDDCYQVNYDVLNSHNMYKNIIKNSDKISFIKFEFESIIKKQKLSNLQYSSLLLNKEEYENLKKITDTFCNDVSSLSNSVTGSEFKEVKVIVALGEENFNE